MSPLAVPGAPVFAVIGMGSVAFLVCCGLWVLIVMVLPARHARRDERTTQRAQDVATVRARGREWGRDGA